jgi:H+/Cl- antiporter ClcA
MLVNVTLSLLMNIYGKPKIRIDRFTAKAGAAVLIVIAGGFLFVALNALVTGCIRLKNSPHGSGLLHCKPEMPYWVATLSLLALGLVLLILSAKVVKIAGKGIRNDSEERQQVTQSGPTT